MPSFSTSNSIDARIYDSARLQATPVSLHQLYVFGKQGYQEERLLQAARFLHREIPIRLSHRLVELASLPHGLSDSAHIQRVQQW